MPSLRPIFFALSWFALAAVTCNGGGGGTPAPDTCTTPDELILSSLEIGSSQEPVFSPLSDGNEVFLVTGGQGSDMIGLRLRLVGDDLPLCVAQTTTIRASDDSELASISPPLRTYEEVPGVHTTTTLWIPVRARFEVGSTISIDVMAGGITSSLALMLVSEP